jgi:hypothetical protein
MMVMKLADSWRFQFQVGYKPRWDLFMYKGKDRGARGVY